MHGAWDYLRPYFAGRCILERCWLDYDELWVWLKRVSVCWGVVSVRSKSIDLFECYDVANGIASIETTLNNGSRKNSLLKPHGSVLLPRGLRKILRWKSIISPGSKALSWFPQPRREEFAHFSPGRHEKWSTLTECGNRFVFRSKAQLQLQWPHMAYSGAVLKAFGNPFYAILDNDFVRLVAL